MMIKQTLLFCLLTITLQTTACSADKEAVPSLLDIDNNAWTAEQMQGKWLIINYWAIWCGPCRDEIPELNHFATEFDNKVLVFGVNFDGINGDKLRKQSDQMGIEFISLAEDPASWFELTPSQVLPVTHIINPLGERVDSLIGPQTLESLKQAIEQSY